MTNKDFLDNWKNYNIKLNDLEIEDDFLFFKTSKVEEHPRRLNISTFNLNSLLLNQSFQKDLYNFSANDFYNIVKVNNLHIKENEDDVSIKDFNSLLQFPDAWKPKSQKKVKKFLESKIKLLIEYEDYLITSFSKNYLKTFFEWFNRLKMIENKNFNQSFIEKEFDKIIDNLYEQSDIHKLSLQNANAGFISAIAILAIVSQIGVFIAALLLIKH